MTHELRQYGEASVFLDAARPIWEPHEAELNLLVGVACSIRDGRWRPPSPALFATLEQEGRPVAAVMRTPPSGFIVAEGEPGAAIEVARALADRADHRDASTVIASSPAAAAFAEAWARAAGVTATLAMAQRIYELTEVIPPAAAPGRSRLATLEDAQTVAGWLHALHAEATLDPPVAYDETLAGTRRRIEARSMFVWETDGGLVSVAALARPTPNGVAVNAVYTPPEHRGRGYASSCVAAISQHALDSGKRFTCLYTDASNPTSNAIYQRIGYRFVCESEQRSLVPARTRRGSDAC